MVAAERSIDSLSQAGVQRRKKWSGYRRRNLRETKMHCFKQLGERVMTRKFERRLMELRVGVALLIA